MRRRPNDWQLDHSARRAAGRGDGGWGLGPGGVREQQLELQQRRRTDEQQGPVTLNMLTWNDHYDPQKQLPGIKKETGITVDPTLGSDDASMFIKAKESGQFDIVSADALWVPYYHQQGLTVRV